MKEEYKDKTKEQLIDELVGLRQRIAELEASENERKRVEGELKQKTEQQEVLLSSIPAFIYYKDIESNLIAVNKAFAEMVNVPIDQLAGKDAYDLFPKEQAKKFHSDDKKVMTSGRPITNLEEKFTDAEGKTRWASTSKVPSFDEKGKVTGMVGITFDIAERKRAEEKLKASLKKLKESEEKLQLVGSVTRHDVANELFVISGFAQMARENTKDNVILNCSEKIEESVGAAENVLKFSKEYQKLGVEEPEWRDMRTSCENEIFAIPLNSITVRNDLEGLEIYTDSLIERVFSNLADNTIRHGGEVSEIKVYYKEFENGLKLIYEDDGVGVPDSKKEIIFERGYGDNTGYGLDLIKRILEISGMGIKETGEPGKGARFEITVPKDRYRISRKQKINYRHRLTQINTDDKNQHG